MAKKNHCVFASQLKEQGVDLKKDYFDLDGHDIGLVVSAAKRAGYRKSKNAPGATARMYWQLLRRRCSR